MFTTKVTTNDYITLFIPPNYIIECIFMLQNYELTNVFGDYIKHTV